jgi:hypothetical protein
MEDGLALLSAWIPQVRHAHIRPGQPLWVAKTPLRSNWRHRAALEGDCVAREVTPGLDHDLDVLGLWDWNRPSEDRE